MSSCPFEVFYSHLASTSPCVKKEQNWHSTLSCCRLFWKAKLYLSLHGTKKVSTCAKKGGGVGLGWSLKKRGNVLYLVHFTKHEKTSLNLPLHLLFTRTYDSSIFCSIEKIGEDIYISIAEFLYIHHVFIHKINSIL